MKIRTPMIVEFEIVRLADEQPEDLVWNYWGRLTPWPWLLATALVGTTAGAGLFLWPLERETAHIWSSHCGCGNNVFYPEPEPAPPQDSTRLVLANASRLGQPQDPGSTRLVRAPWTGP